MPPILLPHRFEPRPYQLPVLRALDGGATRAVIMWHRRAGKEKTLLNYMIKKSMERVGTYFYLFPTYKQAKKAIWNGMDRTGFKFLDHFPAEYVERRNETDLLLHLRSGSIFQLIGTDNIDSIMSTNPIGCVFAEYSLQNPAAWEYIRPILRENGGWAAFDFTPRGKNHAHKIYEIARKQVDAGNPKWFVEKLTPNETGVVTPEMIQEDREEGMSEEMIEQEYFLSFEGIREGAYYGKEMQRAEREERICKVPHEPNALVDTWWDLGIRDAMVIWFTQTVGREVHVIDYYSETGEGLPHYRRMLDEKAKEFGYSYGTHNGPHDIKVRELGSGKSRYETAEALGIKFEMVPNIPVQDGIDQVRSFLGKCWFDREKTEAGRLALMSYHKSWDEARKVFSSHPEHDWSSDPADAFRYLAVGHKIKGPKRQEIQRPVMISTSAGGAGWMGG